MSNLNANAIVSLLTESLDSEKILTGDLIGADYGRDEFPGLLHMPEVVVTAKTTEDVSAVLKVCSNSDIPVTVRGAGTGKVGGSVPVNGGVVLSTKGMTDILSVDEANKTLTVQAGVLLQDVKAEAEKHGLYYPPDPGEATATIGGNVATNASGPCAVKYGYTKDYILDAIVVLANGTITKLSDCGEHAPAIIGSEGTLAVITEITLKLVDKPANDVILLFPFMDTETCLRAATKIQEEGFNPAILEYLDTDMVEFSGKVTGNPVFPIEIDGDRVDSTLMVTLEGNSDDELDEKMESIAELAEDLECLDILVVDSPTLKRDAWGAHDAFHTSTETAKSADELNLSVPMQNVAEMLRFSKALGEEKGFSVMAYAHVGSGGLHLHAISDMPQDEFAVAMAAFASTVYSKCAELGGDIAGEYGIGFAKKVYPEVSLNKEAYEKLTAAKAALDPQMILNPGKVVR